MANNRASLKCSRCPKDRGFHLFKYYPSQGWYLNRNEHTFSIELDAWFEKHKHGELFGAHIYLDLEAKEDIDMSLARGVLLTEIARLEKCIEEKRAIKQKFDEDRKQADTSIAYNDNLIAEMSARVRELRSEVDRMIDIRPPLIRFGMGTEAKPETATGMKAHVSEVGHFPQADLKMNEAAPAMNISGVMQEPAAHPDIMSDGLKWTGWKAGQGGPAHLAGQIVGKSGELIEVAAVLGKGVSLDAAIIMLDKVFVSTPQKPQENFRPAKPIEMLRSDMEKELASFEKCMAEARNFQAHIDSHRAQQKEWEGMATEARKRASRIQAAINALEGKEV